MPYYVPFDEGPEGQPLGAFTPSFGESLRNAVSSTFNENVSTLLYDADQLAAANRATRGRMYEGARLSRADAQAQAQAAGVSIDVPESGYTQEALDILIQRRQDQAARQSIDARTPWGFGSVVRGGAQLLTGIVDPLNVASAFVPVVGEVRAASLLARAGESVLARTGVRAAIGATEGAVGAAMLEPIVFAAHDYLGDDYRMTDTLVNLAFGAALGSVVHAGAGVLPDIRARAVRRELDAFRAEGEAASLSAQSRIDLAGPEIREVAVRSAVADAMQGRAPDVEALITRGIEQQSDANTVAWLGDSKVVDEQGQPLVVYHAAEFDPKADVAVVTSAPEPAIAKAGEAPEPMHARIENPLVVRDASEIAAIQASPDAVAGLKAQGYDGVILKADDGAPQQAIVFDRGQLRSAAEVARGGPRLTDPDPNGAIRATAERQTSAERLAVGSPDSARAASERVALAPKDNGTESAKALLTDAMDQLKDVQRGLEASGALTPEQIARVNDSFKTFDEQIADSAKISDAIAQYAICSLRK